MSELITILTAAGLTAVVGADNGVPQGRIGEITIDATLEEVHSTGLQVTDHPVQRGAPISDHSFRKPIELRLRCGWSNSSSAAFSGAVQEVIASGGELSVDNYVTKIYSQLLALQESGNVFSIVTTLRVYDSMLMTGLQVLRDQRTSQALMVTATCREVIIADTSTDTLPAIEKQKNPADTAGVRNVGHVTVFPDTPNSGGAIPPAFWQTGAPRR